MKLSERAVAIATTFTLTGLLAFAVTTASAQAQTQPSQQPPDSVVAVVANAMSLPFVPPEQRPVFGTFWEVRSSLPCLTAPLPFPPFDTNAPVYSIGDPIIGGQFLVDETAGQVISQEAQSSRRALRSMTTASIVQAQAEELQTFVAGVQARQAYALARANGQTPLSLDGPPIPGEGGGGGTNGWEGGGVTFDAKFYTTNDLWLEIVKWTNATGFFIVHPPDAEATTGVYDLFMTTNLSPNVPGLNLTNWLWILRTEPGETNLIVPDLWADQAYFMLGRTNDTDADGMSDAYEHLVSHTNPTNADTPTIVSQPLSQDVLEGDTVTFTVVATGAPALTYQWACNGTNITGATGSSYTISTVLDTDAGGYTVTVASGATSVSSQTAQLIVEPGFGDPLLMVVLGPRQDYLFKSGVTYYVGSPVELYGTTTIRGGSVIKFDWHTNSSLVVKGALVCDTQPFYPAILTSVDDDSQGQWLWQVSSGSPQPAANGVAFLNLDAASSHAISNLRICFADQGVTTPLASRALEVWDCQFVRCGVAVANQVPGFGARDSLHNVLFACCGAAIGASTNAVQIDAEHVTADVTNLWTAPAAPYRIALTNSIIVGALASASLVITQNVALNPSGAVFQSAGYGNYYLAPASPWRGAGTTSISPRLAAEFQRKTTAPPLALPARLQVSGEMTLLPQAPRYAGGAPDLGFWYDALDYTVAAVFLAGGTITVEPGTAIAVRNEYLPARDSFTYTGFDVQQGSTFISRGTPAQPNLFTAEKMVQETPETDFSWFQIAVLYDFGVWLPGAVSFIPDYQPVDETAPAPTLDFRFSQFYLPSQDYHLWSGFSEDGEILMSLDSSMYWSLRDCALRGGRINLGLPDYFDFGEEFIFAPGGVSWNNTLFDQVMITLMPTFYYDIQVVNCDLPFQAFNNLFRGGAGFLLMPMPTSGGNWVVKDNLFDKVGFWQDTAQPLDHDHNGYWPVRDAELAGGNGATRLLPTVTGDGTTNCLGDQVLTSPPPNQTGPLGRYYLPDSTPLYRAGSRTATDAGLYHYTTRVNQTKEGAGHMVDIGLHYVATAGVTSAQPKDSDGDGIPDFVENWHGDGNYTAHTNSETDWQAAYTISGVYDPTNSIYDDADLSGSGLSGRIKKALGMQPFDTSNPLTLTLASSPDSSHIRLAAPLSFGLATSVGGLSLHVDGRMLPLLRTDPDTGGSSLLTWDTTYDTPGTHVAQVELYLTGQTNSGAMGAMVFPTVAVGNRPFQYPITPDNPAWAATDPYDRLDSVIIPQSWKDTASSWQFFCSAVANPYFRTLWLLGDSMTDSYNAAKASTRLSVLSEVENDSNFGTNTVRFLHALDVHALEADDSEGDSLSIFDYFLVCHMAGQDTALNSLDQTTLRSAFSLVAWDANTLIASTDYTSAAAPVKLMYAAYAKLSPPPVGVTLDPLTPEQLWLLDRGHLPPELIPAINSVVTGLGLTSRP